MSGDFLRRWSRLKRETKATTPQPAPQEAASPLPSLDSLSFESDFKAFMHSKVEEGVKRAALKKLFSDPRFNVMDGLDTYIDDYSKENPISEELLAQLDHARTTLFGQPKEKEAAEEKDAAQQQGAAQTAKTDVDPAQDPKAL